MTKKQKTLVTLIIFVVALVIYKLFVPITVEALPYYGKLPLGVYWSYFDTTFQKIAYCESRHNLKAKNSGSTASGEFQFLKSSWEYYGKQYWGDEWRDKNVFSEDNRELAWFVYQKYGTSPWDASKYCWNN